MKKTMFFVAAFAVAAAFAKPSVFLPEKYRVDIDGSADVRMDGDKVLVTSDSAVSFVRITWPRKTAVDTLVLNDAWERSYGDIQWSDLSAKRYSPWYFLSYYRGKTCGVGVETTPGAMCCWEVSTNEVTLVLDLRAGGGPVKLGGRTLQACRIVQGSSRPGERTWDFGRRFCRMMCPNPKLPKSPVYGYNDWYCAYGRNTATNFLADARYIMDCAKGCAVSPYVVMDDGWQKNSPPIVKESGRGPWDAAGPNFGMDMPRFCGKIASLGAKPGLWYRPFRAWDELPADQRLKKDERYLDPSVPAVRERIIEDMKRFRDWGFKLVKIDYLCFDLSQVWPCDKKKMRHPDRYIQDDRTWRYDNRTTAEVMVDLYRVMKDSAGDDVVIIGCNAFNHISAGIFEIVRTGNDTSGRNWAWTKNHGVNTLAMRSIQDGAFFKIDADCVGLASEGAVPWTLNRRWMDLLGRSGTPMFVSWKRQLAGPEVRAELAKAFRAASEDRPVAEPLDWMDTPRPTVWLLNGEKAIYNWDSAEDMSTEAPRVLDVSKVDSRYFVDAEGKTFVPVGCNICFPRVSFEKSEWSREEEEKKFLGWVRSFAANGGNYLRIWLGHSFFEIMPDRAGEYDPKAEESLKKVVSLCEKLGVKIKFTLESFRTVHSPSNVGNGQYSRFFNRPLYSAYAKNMHEFLHSDECRRIYLGKARRFKELGFGDSPAVACWELWNEINCIGPWRGDVGPWSDRMLAELAKMFPRQMTTQNLGSFSGTPIYDYYDYLGKIPLNDFMQIHRYLDPGAEQDVCLGPMDVLSADSVRELLDRRPDAPAILAEVGAVKANHTGPSELYAKDKSGMLLHDEIFAPFFAGSAGCGQPWHWDHLYVDGNGLWWHFARFAEAIKGVDPAAEHFRPFRTETHRLRIWGLKGKRTTLLWCRDKKNTWKSELVDGEAPTVVSGEKLPVSGDLECYFPWENRRTTVKNTSKLPDFTRSIVVRITRD